MTCPSCGHSNDAGNRFCEYCGARLDPNQAQEATQVGSIGNPMDTSYDAPTMFVPTDQSSAPAVPPSPEATPAPAPAAPSGEVRCTVCGYVNQAGDRFCDQCGAALSTSTPAVADEKTALAVSSESQAPTPPEGTPVATDHDKSDAALLADMIAKPTADDSPTVPAPADDEVPTQETSKPALTAEPALPAVTEDVAPTPEPTSMPEASASTPEPATMQQPDPAAVASVDRTALEALLQEKRDELAGLEQMATRYQGKAVPAYVTAGMDEVRQAIADTEAQIQALDAVKVEPPRPQVDPAELERLSNLVQEKRDELAGLEQMATRYQGKAVPAYVTAGMDEVRQALSDAENELARLRGTELAHEQSAQAATVHAEPSAPVDAGTSAPAEAPEQPTAPATVWTPPPAGATWNAPEPASPLADAVAAEAVAAVTPEPAPAAPVAAQPRLTVQSSGAVINLPTDKATIVIGREDPISGIFPEVDLTTHGGESGGVSRQHARMHYENGNWTVEDLNSTNYTKVNGNKIAPHTPTAIKDGDQVQFGRVLLTLHTA